MALARAMWIGGRWNRPRESRFRTTGGTAGMSMSSAGMSTTDPIGRVAVVDASFMWISKPWIPEQDKTPGQDFLGSGGRAMHDDELDRTDQTVTAFLDPRPIRGTRTGAVGWM